MAECTQEEEAAVTIDASPKKPGLGRTDWSTDEEKMREAVSKWDEIMVQLKRGDLDMKEWGTILFTRGSPSKRKSAEIAKMNPSSFQNYAHNETSKRTHIGSKLGRNKDNNRNQKCH